jgi:hypothetical protein
MAAVCIAACVVAIAPASAVAAFGFDSVGLEFSDADGSPATQAGSHPFAMTTTIRLNASEDSGTEAPEGSLKHLRIAYPVGLAVRPHAVALCTMASFNAIDAEGRNDCPDSSAIGIARVTASSSGPIPAGSADFRDPAPVYSLVPEAGSAGRIGFVAAGQPIVVDLGLSKSAPHRSLAAVSSLTESALFYRVRLTAWGNPADPAHDPERGECAFLSAGTCPSNVPNRPYLTLPRSCAGPLSASFDAISWQEPTVTVTASANTPGLTGCGSLAFLPQVEVGTTSEWADTPAGLDARIHFHDEGFQVPASLAQSEPEGIEVRLPEGMVGVEPDSICSPAQLEAEAVDSLPGEACPVASGLGTIEVETPLLPGTVMQGQVFAGAGDALYVVVRDQQLGILVKQIGFLQVDPFTGQLSAVFDSLPQLPVSSLRLRLEENGQGPLVMLRCGEYVTGFTMTPWSQPSGFFLATSSFGVVAGVGGGPCPEEEEEEPAPQEPATPATPSVTTPPAAAAGTAPRRTRRRCVRRKRSPAPGRPRCVRRCSKPRAGERPPRRCPRPRNRRRD